MDVKHVALAARIEHIRQDNLKMQSKEDESKRRMLAMLAGSQCSMFLKTCFSGWQELMSVLKQERDADRLRSEMKSKNDAQKKGLLGMLMGSQGNLIEKASVPAWLEVLLQKKEEASIERVRMEMKVKGAESSTRMLGMLLGAQKETLRKSSVAGWHEVAHVASVEKRRQEGRTKEQETQRRMLALLMGSQGSLMLKTSFSAWWECVYETKKLRDVEEMRRNMKSKGDESSKRMLVMLMHLQGEVLLKAASAGWRETTVESKTERMREELRGNLSQMKEWREEGSRRMLRMPLGSQSELIMTAMFSGLSEEVSCQRQEREKEKCVEVDDRGSGSSRHMSQMTLGSQGELILLSTFTAWKDAVSVLKQEREFASVKWRMGSQDTSDVTSDWTAHPSA